MGAVPMTSRGVTSDEFASIVEFIDKGTNLALKLKSEAGPKLSDFREYLAKNGENHPDIKKLKSEVVAFAS